MRPLSEIRFIRDRVLEHIRTHPPTGPLLGEPAPVGRPPSAVCQRGHTAMVWMGKQRRCAECVRMWREGR